MGHGCRKCTLSHFQFITLNFSHNSPLLSPFSWYKKTLLKMANSLLVQVSEWLTCVRVCLLSPVWLSATPWTGAHQAPLSMGFSKQDYWSGLSFPTPGDLPRPEMEPASSTLAGRHFTTLPPGKPEWLPYAESKTEFTGREINFDFFLNYCFQNYLLFYQH